MSAATISCRIGAFHFGSDFGSCSNLDQISLADSGAASSGIAPKRPVGDQFWPEREEAALGGLDGMDGAAVGTQEPALAPFRLSQAEQVFGAVDVTGFEFSRAEVDEGRGADHVFFGEIDVAAGVATLDAALLAGKA